MRVSVPKGEELEELELDLLLEAVARRYGYDFREYARRSLRRRVRVAVASEGVESISALQDRILRDQHCLRRFVTGLSVHVTRMFRNPEVYLAFRRLVVPLLRTYPFIRIWHAGCASGEEVYSMAILLREEGLQERSLLYATDISDELVQAAKRGVYSVDALQRYAQSHRDSGGTGALSDYFVMDQGNAVVRDTLRKNMVFSQHSLVTDGSFNEFHVILCRNVLIYFDQSLRARVHRLLYESLGLFGVLVLGPRETIDYSPHAGRYERIDAKRRIYRRTR